MRKRPTAAEIAAMKERADRQIRMARDCGGPPPGEAAGPEEATRLLREALISSPAHEWPEGRQPPPLDLSALRASGVSVSGTKPLPLRPGQPVIERPEDHQPPPLDGDDDCCSPDPPSPPMAVVRERIHGRLQADPFMGAAEAAMKIEQARALRRLRAAHRREQEKTIRAALALCLLALDAEEGEA